MMDNLYMNVATETLEVLNNSDDEVLQNIPKSVIERLNEISNKDYNCELDSEKTLEEQDLLPETLDFIAGLYMRYLSSDEEKKEFYSKYENSNQQSVNLEIKDIDEMFNNNIKEELKENVALIETKKESWFMKIVNKIKKLFSRKEI